MKRVKNLIKNYWLLFSIVVVTFFLLGFRLGRNLFYDWDECIYVQYGKEMRLTGNWLTNQWNGLLGFEKPPLFGWLLQLPYSFGISEFTARTLSVLFTLVLLIGVYIFAKKFFNQRVAILSSLLLLASEVIIVYSIRVNTDTPYTFFIFLGVFFWLMSYKKSSLSYLAGLFFGLAVMTKGLGVLAYLGVIFISIFLDFKKERLADFVKMIGIFLIAILPWHLYQYFTHGQQFLRIYLYENLIQRANNPIEFHFGGPGYYLKLIYRELFPWIFVAAILPIYYLLNLKKYTRLQAIKKELKNNVVLFTLILLILIPLISLTRFQTKLPWYAMPLYPYLLIYLAYNIDLLLQKLKLNWLFYLIAVLIALDAFRLLYGETRFYQAKRDVPPRYAALIKAREFPQPDLYYLVDFSERQAKATLAPQLTTSTTFIYGGNPCSRYYTGKRVQYFYDPQEFVQAVETNRGLYFIENGDLHFIENLPVKTLYRNTSFTLFQSTP